MSKNLSLKTLRSSLSWPGRAAVVATLIGSMAVGFSGQAFASTSSMSTTLGSTNVASTVKVDVIGDSLSTGYRTPGDTWPDQAQALIDSEGLNASITTAAENGAGYVKTGSSGDVFLDLINRVVTSQAQIVVVFGSDNDAGQSGLQPAVTAALARVKVLAPEATIIVVGPTSESDDPAGALTAIRTTLAAQAAAIDAHFVDPVALGWFQGDSSQFLTTDLEHPNTAGEVYLAEQMNSIISPVIKRIDREVDGAGGYSNKLPLAVTPSSTTRELLEAGKFRAV